LGELKHSKRAPILNGNDKEGLYYYLNNGTIVFYDKVKEQKAKGNPIPELYQNRNTLRYEKRFNKRLPAVFNVERVTAAMLYSEGFYMDVINRWANDYKAINKVNDISLNLNAMRTKKDLYTMGVLSLVQQFGELEMYTQIKEGQKTGTLSKKQAFDLKQAITEACKTKTDLTAPNEVILELDKKVKAAVRFYR
jgi:hypothetical protein